MFREVTIRDWFADLKSDSPAPGGGGVAAMSGANGIALIMMVIPLARRNMQNTRQAASRQLRNARLFFRE